MAEWRGALYIEKYGDWRAIRAPPPHSITSSARAGSDRTVRPSQVRRGSHSFLAFGASLPQRSHRSLIFPMKGFRDMPRLSTRVDNRGAHD